MEVLVKKEFEPVVYNLARMPRGMSWKSRMHACSMSMLMVRGRWQKRIMLLLLPRKEISQRHYSTSNRHTWKNKK